MTIGTDHAHARFYRIRLVARVTDFLVFGASPTDNSVTIFMNPGGNGTGSRLFANVSQKTKLLRTFPIAHSYFTMQQNWTPQWALYG
jgi:hypothetical protein